MKTATQFPDDFDGPPERASAKYLHNRMASRAVQSQVAHVFAFVESWSGNWTTDNAIQTGLKLPDDLRLSRHLYLLDTKYVDRKPSPQRTGSAGWLATKKRLEIRLPDCDR